MIIYEVRAIYYYGGYSQPNYYLADNEELVQSFCGKGNRYSVSSKEIEFFFDYNVPLAELFQDGRSERVLPPDWWQRMTRIGNGKDRFQYHRPDYTAGCESSQVFTSMQSAREARINGSLEFCK